MGSTSNLLPAIPAAAMLASCQGAAGETEAPELLEAEFTALDEVVLTFSEPMAPVGEVDPDRFRLGAAFLLPDSTLYYDLAHHFPNGVPGTDGDEPVEPRHAFNDFVEIWADPDDPTRVHLRLYYAVEHYLCDTLGMASELGVQAAIHIHYNQGSSAPVTDLAGNPLGPIGPIWVFQAFAYQAVGEFPDLDFHIELPCPLPAHDHS